MSTNYDTTSAQYWLNWRFLLCSIWVLSPMVAAAILIWKHEGRSGQAITAVPTPGVVYSEEAWRPCFKHMNPAWLLAYRAVSFSVLLTLFIVNLKVDGANSLFYYTVWTFLLVTIYFAIGTVLSIHGCRQHLRQHLHGHGTERMGLIIPSGKDQGMPHTIEGTMHPHSISNSNYGTGHRQNGIWFHEGADNMHSREIAGFWGYLFQIVYQTNAGAVMITDCVFWFIIFPFRAMKDYNFDLLLVGMHSVNAVFLIGDLILNSLRFPWFRIAYFLLYTGVFVIFQWVVHACVSMWWPYPFLDLSSPLSPLWYLTVAVLHVPCYAVFPLAMKLKHYFFSRLFPNYYHLLN